jgi:TRAP-type C4-dicarboxylate transport system substrate-binding protein
MKRFSARLAGVAGLALALAAPSAWAAEKLRISLDTNPSHVRNKTTELFVEELKRRAPGKFEIEVYPSGQLFRDRDVAKALRQGGVEMAIPGTWQLDGLVPSMAISSLPVFYGLTEEFALKIMDGKVGQEINKRTEEKLRVKVLGPWMNLGFQNFYSVSKPIQKHEDLANMKMRYSGGSANAERITFLGATPTLIPWPDVPLALSSSTVDGIASTHESVGSAKLWESGLKYAFEDRQWFGQYVPMVSQVFWTKLSPDLQNALVESWAAIIGKGRAMAAEGQKEARAEMEKQGVKVVPASEAALRQWREKLMTVQGKIVADMKMEPDLVKLAVEEVSKLDAPGQ